MRFKPALAMIRDAYYRRLCSDLERQSRRRKIGCDRLAVVRAVQRLPKGVTPGLQEITQSQLNEAHAMADLIESHLNGKWLYYDYSPQIMVLHGSFGSRQ